MELEEILNLNYRGVFDKGSVTTILEAMSSEDNLEDKTFLFIHKFAKVTSHLIEWHLDKTLPYLSGLFKLNIQGIEAIEKELAHPVKKRFYDEQDSVGASRTIMRLYDNAIKITDILYNVNGDISFLKLKYEILIRFAGSSNPDNDMHKAEIYVNAGDIAMKIFNETKETGYVEQAFVSYCASAEASKSKDKMMQIASLNSAANSASEMYRSNQSRTWGLKAYGLYSEAIALSDEGDVCSLSHYHRQASVAANFLFRMTGSKDWLKREIEHCTSSGDLSRDLDRRLAGNSYNFGSKACEEMYKITNDISWVDRWFNMQMLSSELLEDFDKEMSWSGYGLAGKAAGIMFSHTKEKEWGIKEYELSLKSAEMSAGLNDKHSAHSYCYSGNAARKLYLETEEEEWKEKSLTCYGIFLGYYQKNPLPKNMEKLWYAVNNCVNELKKVSRDYKDRGQSGEIEEDMRSIRAHNRKRKRG